VSRIIRYKLKEDENFIKRIIQEKKNERGGEESWRTGGRERPLLRRYGSRGKMRPKAGVTKRSKQGRGGGNSSGALEANDQPQRKDKKTCDKEKEKGKAWETKRKTETGEGKSGLQKNLYKQG